MKPKHTFKETLRLEFGHNLRQYTMFLILFTVWLFFHFQPYKNQGLFITPANISNLFAQASYIAVLAVGMVLVIVAGHIDLSVGSIAGFTGAIAAIVQQSIGNSLLAITAALILGLSIGAWQGFWVAYMRVPAFIVTLAGMTVFRGALLLVTQGKTIPVSGMFRELGRARLPYLTGNFPLLSLIILVIVAALIVLFSYRKRRQKLKLGFALPPVSFYLFSLLVVLALYGFIAYELLANISKNVKVQNAGISFLTLIMFALAWIFHFVANNTRFGLHVYAVGGNKEAARLSGINIERTNMLIFILMGLLSSIAGVIFTAYIASASSSAGNLFELDTIAAAIIGGTSTLGGEGTVTGAIVGALLMTSLNTGMQLMDLGSDWQLIIRGLVLLLAVFFDIMSRKKSL